MSDNTCEIRVGRLLEIRVEAYRTVADVEAMMRSIGGRILTLPLGQRPVIAADWRPVTIFSQDVAEIATTMLTTFNPRVERSGILIGQGHPTTLLQTMRIVRDACHPMRRVFDSPDEMKAWLGEVLSPAELARLEEFL